MKQISIKILFILLMILPFEVKASTLNLKLSCPQTAYLGDTIDCQIVYTNEISLNAIIVKYKLPQDIKYQNLVINKNWNNYYKDKNGFVLGSSTTVNNDIATLKLEISSTAQINKEYQIGLANIDASDINFNSISSENIISTIKIVQKETSKNSTNNNNQTPNNDQITDNNQKEELELNNDSKLKSIKLSYGNINFNSDVFEYIITVPNNVNNINIEATPSSPKAIVTIEKPNKLKIGTNKIIITVEAEDKTISKYIILINKEEEYKETSISQDNGNSALPNIKNIVYLLILVLIILISIIINKIIKKKK